MSTQRKSLKMPFELIFVWSHYHYHDHSWFSSIKWIQKKASCVRSPQEIGPVHHMIRNSFAFIVAMNSRRDNLERTSHWSSSRRCDFILFVVQDRFPRSDELFPCLWLLSWMDTLPEAVRRWEIISHSNLGIPRFVWHQYAIYQALSVGVEWL
jgi:hypothetical protein